MNHSQITNFIWNIADHLIRDHYKRSKYPDVILPFTVLRRHRVAGAQAAGREGSGAQLAERERELNALAYELYRLTEEEIALVERRNR